MRDDARFAFYDLAPGEESFRDAVLNGLARPNKSIPCKFFYDERGSALFEQICRLPEYYPTRTEIGLLKSCGPDIGKLLPPGAVVVEFGSGSSRKTELLLQALERPSAALLDALDNDLDHIAFVLDRLHKGEVDTALPWLDDAPTQAAAGLEPAGRRRRRGRGRRVHHGRSDPPA